MKKTRFLLFCLAVSAINCYSQVNKPLTHKKGYQLKEVGDTFVAEVTFDQPLYQNKCYCSYPRKGLGNLYKGTVKHVYLVPENSIYDSTKLMSVNYFVVNENLPIKADSTYTVSLAPGSTNRYLTVNNLLNVNNPNKYEFVSPENYMSGFVSCYQLGFFTKLFIRTGLLKIGKVNAKTKKIKVDPFDTYIKKAG